MPLEDEENDDDPTSDDDHIISPTTDVYTRNETEQIGEEDEQEIGDVDIPFEHVNFSLKAILGK